MTLEWIFGGQVCERRMCATFDKGGVGLVVLGQLEQHLPDEEAIAARILVVAFQYFEQLVADLWRVVEHVLRALLLLLL